MNDTDHTIGMCTYALLADIENWTDLAKEKAARKLLTKDAPEVIEAIEKLLLQIHTMIHEGHERPEHESIASFRQRRIS